MKPADLYSASATKHLFWLNEAILTAELLGRTLSREQIKKNILEENLYQVRSIKRAVDIFGVVYKRISAMPEDIARKFATVSIGEAKIYNLIGILKTDRLFFELIYEIYREKVIIGESKFKDSDMQLFFLKKKKLDETVNGWTDGTFVKLKQAYARMMIEAGLIGDAKDKAIKRIYIDTALRDELAACGLGAYLAAIAPE